MAADPDLRSLRILHGDDGDDHRQASVQLAEGKLVDDHPAPPWLLPARVALLAILIFALPLDGLLLGAVVVAAWFVSGLVFRYPLSLPKDRALYLGGLGNTARPGRHWLRRRWSDPAHSIPTTPLRLLFSPAPTRLDDREPSTRWLELELELWVAPRGDQLGQFVALLEYKAWQTHPWVLAQKLRQKLLPALVAALGSADLLARSSTETVPVNEALSSAVEPALATLGLKILAHGTTRATLGPSTDNLQTEDRVVLERSDPPA